MPGNRKSFSMRRPLIKKEEALMGPEDILEEFDDIGMYDFEPARDFGYSVISKGTLRVARSTGSLAFREWSDAKVHKRLYRRLSPSKREPVYATVSDIIVSSNTLVVVELESPRLLEDRTQALEILAELSDSPVIGDRTRSQISMVLGNFTTSEASRQWPMVDELGQSFLGEELWFGPIPKELPTPQTA